MGRGINHIMSQAKTALANSQTGLATTQHNVSNVNTPGYSRQRVDYATETPVDVGNVRIGSGAKVNGIARSHSEFLARRMEEEQTSFGRFEGTAEVYAQLESVFKDDGEHGLSKSISRFFNDIRTLSTQPESIPLRSAVKESAQSITSDFRAVADGINSVVQDLNRRVEGSVNEVNALTQKIAHLNQQIMEVEMGGVGGLANDERDSRDMALQQLSKLIEVQTTQLESGAIMVNSGRLGTLVSGPEAVQMSVVRGNVGPHPGAARIMLASTSDGRGLKDITESIESGALGGFIKVRDNEIPTLLNKIDTLAHGFAESVNSAHRNGFSRNGQTGVNFFDPPTGVQNAASQLRLSESITQDPASIAASDVPNASGDNRTLLRIADLQDARIFDSGRSNFTDFSSSLVGDLGVRTRSAIEGFDTQKGVMDQLAGLRESMSGVSLDEEAMNMIKFQKAFDASAKMIQVADSMLETVLNLKRF